MPKDNNTTKWLSIFGTIASITGIAFFYLPTKPTTARSTSGNQSPIINSVGGPVNVTIGQQIDELFPKIFEGYWQTEGNDTYKGIHLHLDIAAHKGCQFGAEINNNYKFNLSAKMIGEATAEFEIHYLSGRRVGEEVTEVGKRFMKLSNIYGEPSLT